MAVVLAVPVTDALPPSATMVERLPRRSPCTPVTEDGALCSVLRLQLVRSREAGAAVSATLRRDASEAPLTLPCEAAGCSVRMVFVAVPSLPLNVLKTTELPSVPVEKSSTRAGVMLSIRSRCGDAAAPFAAAVAALVAVDAGVSRGAGWITGLSDGAALSCAGF